MSCICTRNTEATFVTINFIQFCIFEAHPSIYISKILIHKFVTSEYVLNTNSHPSTQIQSVYTYSSHYNYIEMHTKDMILFKKNGILWDRRRGIYFLINHHLISIKSKDEGNSLPITYNIILFPPLSIIFKNFGLQKSLNWPAKITINAQKHF